MQCLDAGTFTIIPDATDNCGAGGGGGGGGSGGSGHPDPVTLAMPKAAAAGGTEQFSCGAVCGGGSGGNGSGSTGGGGASCCPGDDDDGSGGNPMAGGSDLAYLTGMPVWDVSEPYINLWLYDEPLGYQPGLGPRLSFKLAYKQRAAPLVASNIYSVGTNWTCFWLSYVEDDWSASQAILTLRSGGQITNQPPDGSTIEYYTHTTLLRQPSSGALTGFVRTYPSGATDYYKSIPVHVSLPDGNTPAFLTARVDPSGHTNVVFAYSETQVGGNWVFRLSSVTDADGRACTVSYTNSNATLITGVADPFGRSAVLRYDGSGRLTNVTDTAGLSSSFQYDSQNWITNLATPYGTTTFQHVDNGYSNNLFRACLVIDAAGGTNLYMLREYSQHQYLQYLPWPTNTPVAGFDTGYCMYRESYHWGPLQVQNLSTSDMTQFTDSDYMKSRMRHWLHGDTDCGDDASISQTISLQLDPSPDGVNPGQATWYSYDGMGCVFHVGTNSLPSVVARVLPDGTGWYTAYQRDAWGRATNVTDTYSTDYGATPLTRTRQSVYSGPDLVTVIGPLGETLAGYAYTNHLLLRATNAVGDVTSYTWDSHSRLTSVKTAAGLTHTNLYFASGAYTNFVQTAIDLEISRTNTFTYTNDLVYTHTDERGLSTTNAYDSLNRLTNSANPLGAITYLYSKLDVVQVKDRMGFTNSFAYDAVRRRTAETNALGRATRYNYCSCGALDSIQDAAGNYTYFTYDYAGRLTQAAYPDLYTNNFNYDLLGELTDTTDSAGVIITNWFNNQGQLYAIQDLAGLRSALAFDAEDRVTNSWDANGVSIAMTYDNLGRLLTRTYPDAGVEHFGYSARGLIAYTNQIGLSNFFAYDAAARKTFETNANGEVLRYTNDAAGDLLSLTDGKFQTTRWNYDQYGRVTNKLDQAGSVILTYTYDSDSRLTNRWSAAKGNTGYAYDPVGSLTNAAYPASGTVKFAYDVMNRLTNMVDGVGTNRYTYDAAGQLLTEDGPFTSDTVTNTYSNRPSHLSGALRSSFYDAYS
jgi:YD repeat-containing protein